MAASAVQVVNNSMNSSQSDADPQEDMLPTILVACFLSLLCVVSLVGNFLVVVAVKVESKLHSFTNYFIVSLACADLLISLLVMPLAIVYQVSVTHFIHPVLTF